MVKIDNVKIIKSTLIVAHLPHQISKPRLAIKKIARIECILIHNLYVGIEKIVKYLHGKNYVTWSRPLKED